MSGYLYVIGCFVVNVLYVLMSCSDIFEYIWVRNDLFVLFVINDLCEVIIWLNMLKFIIMI